MDIRPEDDVDMQEDVTEDVPEEPTVLVYYCAVRGIVHLQRRRGGEMIEYIGHVLDPTARPFTYWTDGDIPVDLESHPGYHQIFPGDEAIVG